MATLAIKNLPDELYARLKAQAKERRRSLNNEVITLLERGVAPPRLDAEALIAEAEALQAEVFGDREVSDLDEVLAEAKRERDARPFAAR